MRAVSGAEGAGMINIQRRTPASSLRKLVGTIREELNKAAVECPIEIPTCCADNGDPCGDDPCCCGETTLYLCGACGNGASADPSIHDSDCPKRGPLVRIEAALLAIEEHAAGLEDGYNAKHDG